ncbi:hypothetical protein AAMO2058_001715800 [Amorphochlora amoebiformis]
MQRIDPTKTKEKLSDEYDTYDLDGDGLMMRGDLDQFIRQHYYFDPNHVKAVLAIFGDGLVMTFQDFKKMFDMLQGDFSILTSKKLIDLAEQLRNEMKEHQKSLIRGFNKIEGYFVLGRRNKNNVRRQSMAILPPNAVRDAEEQSEEEDFDENGSGNGMNEEVQEPKSPRTQFLRQSQVIDTVLSQGYLSKRGRHNKKFRMRYFILTADGVLMYYESERDFIKEEKPLGVIDLTCEGRISSHEGESDMDDEGFLFRLSVKGGRIYHLRSTAADERKMWTEAFQAVFRNKRRQSEANKKGKRESGNFGILYPPEGWLEKRGRMNPSYKRRYFRLVNTFPPELRYYKTNDAEAKCKGLIVLQPSEDSIEEGIKKGHHFTVLGQKERIFHLRALDEMQAGLWINTLRKACKRAQRSTMKKSDRALNLDIVEEEDDDMNKMYVPTAGGGLSRLQNDPNFKGSKTSLLSGAKSKSQLGRRRKPHHRRTVRSSTRRSPTTSNSDILLSSPDVQQDKSFHLLNTPTTTQLKVRSDEDALSGNDGKTDSDITTENISRLPRRDSEESRRKRLVELKAQLEDLIDKKKKLVSLNGKPKSKKKSNSGKSIDGFLGEGFGFVSNTSIRVRTNDVREVNKAEEEKYRKRLEEIEAKQTEVKDRIKAVKTMMRKARANRARNKASHFSFDDKLPTESSMHGPTGDEREKREDIREEISAAKKLMEESFDARIHVMTELWQVQLRERENMQRSRYLEEVKIMRQAHSEEIKRLKQQLAKAGSSLVGMREELLISQRAAERTLEEKIMNKELELEKRMAESREKGELKHRVEIQNVRDEAQVELKVLLKKIEETASDEKKKELEAVKEEEKKLREEIEELRAFVQASKGAEERYKSTEVELKAVQAKAEHVQAEMRKEAASKEKEMIKQLEQLRMDLADVQRREEKSRKRLIKAKASLATEQNAMAERTKELSNTQRRQWEARERSLQQEVNRLTLSLQEEQNSYARLKEGHDQRKVQARELVKAYEERENGLRKEFEQMKSRVKIKVQRREAELLREIDKLKGHLKNALENQKNTHQALEKSKKEIKSLETRLSPDQQSRVGSTTTTFGGGMTTTSTSGGSQGEGLMTIKGPLKSLRGRHYGHTHEMRERVAKEVAASIGIFKERVKALKAEAERSKKSSRRKNSRRSAPSEKEQVFEADL